MSMATPMMAQYLEIKKQYQDCILMFRLGDFYEMFFEDAVKASEILQITLTSRNKKSENETQMCGVPYHAVQQYISKLTRSGLKVALCDQVTKPTGKGIVQREVVRVITPGTTFDDSLLDLKNNNFLVAISAHQNIFYFAFVDITTGDFRFTQIDNLNQLESELSRLNPAEVIIEPQMASSIPKLTHIINKLSNTSLFHFSATKLEKNNSLLSLFSEQIIKSFGIESDSHLSQICGYLLAYLKETQKKEALHIKKLNHYHLGDYMILDELCIRNLEIFFSNNGHKNTSLVSIIDDTATAMGGRMLRNWLRYPLIDQTKINHRLDLVQAFVDDSLLVRNIRESLEKIYDIERLVSRLSLGTGNARDLIALRVSLEQVPAIRLHLEKKVSLAGICKDLHPLRDLVSLIESTIVDEPPFSVREGNMVKDGYNNELDELRNINLAGKDFIASLLEQEKQRTKIPTLKIKFNKVFGYYIEISKSQLANVPDNYIRKQTLVNAERFITPELKEYEEKVLTAEERICELEYELFHNIRMQVLDKLVELQALSKNLAFLDVINNFALKAVQNNYCRPQVRDTQDLTLEESRHPVIEQLSSKDFIPNDCHLSSEKNFQLITGPNMGGKSTYLRQIALITLMAQIGCFVPASKAEIGIVDRIFTRVGASDNLAAGESTFMVEMTETAHILNNATERSLIILDEIGRGTSTYDGLSIAWAITEFIHNHIKAKTLFATHYHELVSLVSSLDRGVNSSVFVAENPEEGVVFHYRIVPGGADKSYGIEVAKLAGLPPELIKKASSILSSLENKETKLPVNPQESRDHRPVAAPEDKLKKILQSIDLNNMTPLQALQMLGEIKNQC